MLIINVKPNENIERALKRYKLKFRRTKVKELVYKHSRYTKKSAERRETIKKAIHKREYLAQQEE